MDIKKMLNEKIFPHLGGFRLYETKSYAVKDMKYDELNKIIEQSTVSDVFGFDILLGHNYRDVCMFTSFDVDHERFKPTFVMPHSNLDNEDLKSFFFTFKPRNHEFMPIQMNPENAIIKSILSIKDLTMDKMDFYWIQILCRRLDDRWKDDCISKYEEYLDGIDRPTNNIIIKKIQHKMVDFLKRFDEASFINKEIEEVDMKLNEDGFETVVRMAVHLENKRNINKKVLQLFESFSKTNDFNFWICTEGSRDSIENMRLRRFPLMKSDRHIFCLSELRSILMTPPKVVETPVVIEPKQTIRPVKPIKLNDYTNTPSINSLYAGNEENNYPIDYKKYEDIYNSVLKNIGILKDNKKINVVKIVESASLRKITFVLPKGLNYSHFEKKVVKNIQSHLGVPDISLQMGSESNTIAISTPLEVRRNVFLKNLMETQEFKDFCKKAILPFIIGLTEDGECLMFDLIDAPHLLVGGTTKSGKTQWMNQFILTLILLNNPEKLNLYLIDPKKIEFPIFKRFPHVQEVITDTDQALELIGSLTDEMDDRYTKFANAGVRSIDRYNEKSGEKMPYIVCIVDEVADLTMTTSDEDDQLLLEKYILRLGQKARGAGIHIVLATQRPSTKIITGDIKSNLPSRVCFAMKNTHDYRTIITQQPPRLMGRGDGVAELEGVFGLPRFQGALIANTEKEIDDVIELIADEWDRIVTSDGSVVVGSKILASSDHSTGRVTTKAEPSIIEKAKYFIATERDAKARSLQQYLKVDSREVKSVQEQLISDNWLEAPTSNRSGYTIIASDEEMDDFLEMFANTFVIQKEGY